MNPNSDLKVLGSGGIVAGCSAHFHANVVVQPQCIILWPCTAWKMMCPSVCNPMPHAPVSCKECQPLPLSHANAALVIDTGLRCSLCRQGSCNINAAKVVHCGDNL